MISLHQKLNQLSLTSMARQLDQVMADAAARNLSLAQTLESLADLELEARNSRSIERRFRISRLEYHALLASVQHRFSQGFTLLANYTYSHCISDLDFNGEISASVFQNPSNLRQDRGACIFDARHLFNASVIATSPKVGGKLTSAILGNWQLAPIISAHTGLPMNVTTGTDNSRSGVGLDRPNLALPNAYNSVWGRSLQFLNAAAFQPNAVGTFGNLGRDALFGPGLLQLDAALSRLFSLSERYRLEARFEAFNVVNHTNFAAPAATLSSSSFGRITSQALVERTTRLPHSSVRSEDLLLKAREQRTALTWVSVTHRTGR